MKSEYSFLHSRPSAPELTRTEWIHEPGTQSKVLSGRNHGCSPPKLGPLRYDPGNGGPSTGSADCPHSSVGVAYHVHLLNLCVSYMRFIPYICDFPQFSPSTKCQNLFPYGQNGSPLLSKRSVQKSDSAVTLSYQAKVPYYRRIRRRQHPATQDERHPTKWLRFPQTTLLYS